jgi:hypothetical protein
LTANDANAIATDTIEITSAGLTAAVASRRGAPP